jgi:8-oxo-dGTP pyrophosphatase MutT (NUDIX family)
MLQNYKIFSGQTEIIITSKFDSDSRKKELRCDIHKLSEIKAIIPLIRKNAKHKRIVIIHSKPHKAFSYLASCFKEITAAGGIVRNQKNDILFIHKNDKWDLPKGKLNKNETKKAAALRETSEECGVQKLIITGKIGKTHHIGRAKGKRFFKTTHWYEMFCSDPYNIHPEEKEGITKVKWIKPKKTHEYLAKSYLNIQKLLKIYLKD